MAKATTQIFRATTERGFTLVELMIVMVIMAVAAVLVTPAVRSGTEQREVRRTLQRFVSAVRQSSTLAVYQRRTVELTLRPLEGSYSVGDADEDEEQQGLPALAAFGAVDGGRYEGSDAVIFDFYPTGGSSGGAVELLFATRRGDQIYLLTIDPLISRISVEAVP